MNARLRWTTALTLVAMAGLGILAAPGQAIDVLYVLGGNQAPNSLSRPGDILINNFFTDRGYTVTLMDQGTDGATMLAAANAADLTYISESVGSGNVTNKVTPSTKGVITSESFLQDDLLFTDNDDCCRANATDVMNVDIVNPFGSGVATGVTAVYDQLGQIGWGMPGGDVTAIATLVGQASQLTDYAYEAGATMNDGSSAAGRRVFAGSVTGLTLAPDPVWTAESQALFGAAVDFALVPEPSSLVLLGLGLAGLIGVASRRRRVA